MENVLGSEVVLEAEEIVAGPIFGGVGAGGKLFDESESVLEANGIGKPEAAANDGAGESETGIPIAEMEAFLDVDAGSGIGRAEAPFVVAVGSIEAKDVCAGMRVAGAEAAGLDVGSARGVDVEARSELAVDGIADFEAVEEVLRFAGTSAGDVKIAGIIFGDFGKGDEALGKNVGIGGGEFENVAGGERVALSGVLRIDLIGGSSDLDLLVKFFGVIQREMDFVAAGLKSYGATGDFEEAFLADFQFVIACGDITKIEAAGGVGFGAVDVGVDAFKLYLGGSNGDIVFVDDEAGTRG